MITHKHWTKERPKIPTETYYYHVLTEDSREYIVEVRRNSDGIRVYRLYGNQDWVPICDTPDNWLWSDRAISSVQM